MLPVAGKHAFVVLGYQLKDGEMEDELKSRCDAAAAAALQFPDSILICSGGATGDNNPLSHTEAGLMKQYLVETCGVSTDRIFIDEEAMTTTENALNTFSILKKQGIDTITLVTSSYHQRRAHMLYYTIADFYRLKNGWDVQLIGNWSFETDPASGAKNMDPVLAETQIMEILLRIR